MKLLDFFRIFKRKIASKAKRNAYSPLSWEDDYCQIEIVPAENRDSIVKRATEIKMLADQSREDLLLASQTSLYFLKLKKILQNIFGFRLIRQLLERKFHENNSN